MLGELNRQIVWSSHRKWRADCICPKPLDPLIPTFEQKLEGGQGVNLIDIWGKNSLQEGTASEQYVGHDKIEE